MAQQGAAERAAECLSRLGKPPHRARVLVMGLGCDGRCHAGQPCTLRSLRNMGTMVDFYDPTLSEAACGGLRVPSVRPPSAAGLQHYDVVVLQQPCSGEEYRKVITSARCVLDVRPAEKDCII